MKYLQRHRYELAQIYYYAFNIQNVSSNSTDRCVYNEISLHICFIKYKSNRFGGNRTVWDFKFTSVNQGPLVARACPRHYVVRENPEAVIKLIKGSVRTRQVYQISDQKLRPQSAVLIMISRTGTAKGTRLVTMQRVGRWTPDLHSGEGFHFKCIELYLNEKQSRNHYRVNPSKIPWLSS